MRWPVIIFSRITVFGESFDLFPRSEIPKPPDKYSDARDKNIRTLFLLPSGSADAEVVSADGNRLGACAAMAGAMFMIRSRGLLLSECDILTEGKTHRILSSTDGRKMEIIVDKCKLLCSNKPVTLSNIDLSCYLLSDEIGAMCAFECADSEMFEDQILKSALFAPGLGVNPCAAVAFSRDRQGVNAKGVIISDGVDEKLRLARCVATIVQRKEQFDTLEVFLDGETFVFRCEERGYAVSSQALGIFTFSAPDIL